MNRSQHGQQGGAPGVVSSYRPHSRQIVFGGSTSGAAHADQVMVSPTGFQDSSGMIQVSMALPPSI